MSIDTTTFARAQERVRTLQKPPLNADQLELYALYQQATIGDVEGPRPGVVDFVGRAKFDAWSGKKGINRHAAMERYVALVQRLLVD